MIIIKHPAIKILINLTLLILFFSCTKNENPPVEPTPVTPALPQFPVIDYVFKNGTEGYACFRIPAIIKTPGGDLLAFAEARLNNCDDNGNIDLVMKRSTDKGKSWTSLIVLVDNGNYKAASPAPVVDFYDPNYREGRIFLLYNTITDYKNASGSIKRVTESWYKTSKDGGSTWQQAANITTQIHRPNAPEYNAQYDFADSWSSSINTPGHALQLQRGINKGRIYVAANHAFTSTVTDYSNYRSYGYFSDDHGNTWHKSDDIDIPGGNESTAAELSDGTLLQNSRYQNTLGIKRRILAISKTFGESWEPAFISDELVDPICQGSMIDVEYNGKHILLFSNPASETKRERMTISVSKNNGLNWPLSYVVDNDIAAYSDLVALEQQNIGLIYERGNTGGIVFKLIKLAEILKE